MPQIEPATAALTATAMAMDAAELYRRQRQWLVGVLLLNLGSIPIDVSVLGTNDGTILRLAGVTPFVVLGLLFNRFSHRFATLNSVMGAAAIISFIAADAIIGQWASEPFASRYMMAALFVLFTSAIFTALPWAATRLQTLLATAAFAGIVVTGFRLPPRFDNFEMVGLSVMVALTGLHIRREKEAQQAELNRVRQLEAQRTVELRQANARLVELSTIDALTGVFNRRYLEDLINNRTPALVPNSSVGALMVDVDNFKLFNDRGGHAAGDRCLQAIATALRETLRSNNDVLARYGGEEFAVILPDADLDEALAVADRLRLAVIALRMTHPGFADGRFVTVSIGAATAHTMADVEDALDRADRQLYQAKQAGRNRVLA